MRRHRDACGDRAMTVSFETEIKPLFRPRDRNAMLRRRNFDLWKYEDVVIWADRILEQVSMGLMPCDQTWPPEKVDLFRVWANGKRLP